MVKVNVDCDWRRETKQGNKKAERGRIGKIEPRPARALALVDAMFFAMKIPPLYFLCSPKIVGKRKRTRKEVQGSAKGNRNPRTFLQIPPHKALYHLYYT
jgi:hypothetical protein